MDYRSSNALGFTDIKTVLTDPTNYRSPFNKTSEMSIGSYLHAWLLEDEPEYVVCKYKSGLEWEEMNRKHALVIPEVYLAKIDLIKDGLHDLKVYLNKFTKQIKEQPFYAEENGIPIKAKPDMIGDDILFDVKFTERNISNDYEREKYIANGNYYIQLAHYKDILEKNNITINKCILILINYANISLAKKHNGTIIIFAEMAEEYLRYGLLQRNNALSTYKLYNGDFSSLARKEAFIAKPNYFKLPEETRDHITSDQ